MGAGDVMKCDLLLIWVGEDCIWWGLSYGLVLCSVTWNGDDVGMRAWRA